MNLIDMAGEIGIGWGQGPDAKRMAEHGDSASVLHGDASAYAAPTRPAHYSPELLRLLLFL